MIIGIYFVPEPWTSDCRSSLTVITRSVLYCTVLYCIIWPGLSTGPRIAKTFCILQTVVAIIIFAFLDNLAVLAPCSLRRVLKLCRVLWKIFFAVYKMQYQLLFFILFSVLWSYLVFYSQHWWQELTIDRRPVTHITRCGKVSIIFS